MRPLRSFSAFALVVLYFSAFGLGITRPKNLIQQENAKKGTTAWVLSNPAYNHEIEGYASFTSINRGQSIAFYVNTTAPRYTIDVFRMGWYGGSGARRMTPSTTLSGVRQQPAVFSPQTGLIECQWTSPYVLYVPVSSASEWISGMYVAKLTAQPSGRQAYIVFVVRDDVRNSALLFQSSIATYQAYNDWGGWSLYTNPRAYKVSFNRPYLTGFGAPPIFAGAWEYSMLRFLEREGYDVSYSTDVDTHEHGDLILRHKGFLVVGHDEYWSWQMRTNVELARDRGVNLGFFSANNAYWQVRFEPSVLSGAADRVMVCYKDANLDPLFHSSDQSHVFLTTTQFRLPPVNRPEELMIGVMFENGHGEDADIVIEDASSWVFQGTGLKKGDHLKGLLGYETDRIFDSSPTTVHRIAHSPYPSNGTVHYSDMTLYTVASGSVVVATGSMQWCWGLDAFPYKNRLNKPAQQATRNILGRFVASKLGK
jgi:hypothetical protein